MRLVSNKIMCLDMVHAKNGKLLVISIIKSFYIWHLCILLLRNKVFKGCCNLLATSRSYIDLNISANLFTIALSTFIRLCNINITAVPSKP